MVDKAIRALAKAKRIEFFGMAGPGVVAMDAYNKFFRLGISSAFYNDSQMQNMSAFVDGWAKRACDSIPFRCRERPD